MRIATTVMKRLNESENKELAMFLDELEHKELMASGLNNISGGFVIATAFDICVDDDIDLIEIQLESGESGVGYTNSQTTCGTIPRQAIADKGLTVEEKLAKVQF